MPEYIIQLKELATGQPSPHAGRYVTHYDPSAEGGRGLVTTTDDPHDALRLPSGAEAIEYAYQAAGTRADGKPNRPLAAFHLAFVPAPERADA